MLKDWEEKVNKKYEQYEWAGNFCKRMKPNVNSRNEIYDIGDEEFNLTTDCVQHGKIHLPWNQTKKNYKNRNQKG